MFINFLLNPSLLHLPFSSSGRRRWSSCSLIFLKRRRTSLQSSVWSRFCSPCLKQEDQRMSCHPLVFFFKFDKRTFSDYLFILIYSSIFLVNVFFWLRLCAAGSRVIWKVLLGCPTLRSQSTTASWRLWDLVSKTFTSCYLNPPWYKKQTDVTCFLSSDILLLISINVVHFKALSYSLINVCFPHSEDCYENNLGCARPTRGQH